MGAGKSLPCLYQSPPGLIRVDADEVTYPLHVILRYRLEKALLTDDLPLDDLPLPGMTEWGSC